MQHNQRSIEMITRKQIITSVAVLAIGTSLAIAAPQAQNEGDHGWGGHHRGHEFGAKFAEKLNLSDAQKQQIKDIKTASHQQNEAFFKSFHQTMEDFQAAKKAGDTAKVDSLKTTFDSQRAQMKAIKDAERDKVLNLLTPDQRARYDAMKAKHAAEHQNKQ
jgi:Spy/CpxP family protein refolding chaperone